MNSRRAAHAGERTPHSDNPFGALHVPTPFMMPGTETEPGTAPTPTLPPRTDPPAAPPQRQPAPPGPATTPGTDPDRQPEVIPGPCRF